MCFPQNKQKAVDTSLNIHLYFAGKRHKKGDFKLSFGPVKDKDPCNTVWVWLLDLSFSAITFPSCIQNEALFCTLKVEQNKKPTAFLEC